MKKMNDTKKLGGIVAIVAAAAVVIAISANAVDQRGNRQENQAASVRTNTAASGGVQRNIPGPESDRGIGTADCSGTCGSGVRGCYKKFRENGSG